MPTYQYACTNATCGNRFELTQAFTDPSVTKCPICGQSVRKVYGSVGVVFKGSGFYRTDSRAEKATANGKRPGNRGGATADSGGSDSSSSKSGSGTAADSASGPTNTNAGSPPGSGSGSARSTGSGSAAKAAASA